MIGKLCEPEHLWIIIGVLLVALLVVGAGKGGGKLLLKFLKKVFGGEEININLPGGDMGEKPLKEMCKGCMLGDIPKNCPFHEAEHERSKRNEDEIHKLWEHYGKLGEEMRAGIAEINKSISTSQTTILNNQTAILEAIRKRGAK